MRFDTLVLENCRRFAQLSLEFAPGLNLILGANGQQLNATEALGREVVRGVDRGGLLLAVGRGRYIYNLDFPL